MPTDTVTAAHLRPLAEGVFAWIGARGDSNAGAIDTPEGLLVIDAQQHAGLARRFREALREAVDKPVRALIDTHYHLDHIAGNVVFADEAPILAHEKTLEKLHTHLGPDDGGQWVVTDLMTKIRMFYGPNTPELIPDGDPGWAWFEQRFAPAEYDTMVVKPPTETFADSFAFHLPGDRVRLDYHGPAHCDGDLIVYLERRKVAFLGDLLFCGRFPWLGDSDLDGWIATLEHVLTLDLDVVVPGHGVPVTLREVAWFRDLLAALREAVARSIAGGSSEEAAVREVELPAFAEIPRYREWIPYNVRNAYRYLRAA